MLQIKIHNDSTGDVETGYYNYDVFINQTVIASGRIEGHKRREGWTSLVQKLVDQENKLLKKSNWEFEKQNRPAVQKEKVKQSSANTEDNGDERKNRLIPVTKWNDYHSWPTISGLRHLIFFEHTNGFNQCIRRVGRRVVIDEDAFFEWVETTNKKR